MTEARFRRRATRARPRGRRFGRVSDVLLAIAIIAALAAVANRLNPPQTFSRSGAAKVHDGDTLTVAGERIRLIGIDAPELKQICRRNGADYPCGRASREALIAMVDGRSVSCQATKRDRYRRFLGECRAGPTDINAALVRAGWAVAYGAAFRQEEAEAREQGEGLWAGTFEMPKDWRTRHGDAAELEYGPVLEWLVSFGEAIGLLDPSPTDVPSEVEKS